MWIKMRETAAGPKLKTALEAGHIYDVPPDHAAELLAAGYAVEVPAPIEKKGKRYIEVDENNNPVEETKPVDGAAETAAEGLPGEKSTFEKLSASTAARESGKKKSS